MALSYFPDSAADNLDENLDRAADSRHVGNLLADYRGGPLEQEMRRSAADF